MTTTGEETIIDIAERIIALLVNEYPELTTSKNILKTGGYISVFDLGDKRLEYVGVVGEPAPHEKWSAYAYNSGEKGTRLLATHEELGHLTSFESRDPENGKWGGAIVAGYYIFSFSGLPEQADEAVMLVVAVELNVLSLVDASAIAIKNNNEIFSTIINYLYDE